MGKYYLLKGREVVEADLMTWAKEFEKIEGRRVCKTKTEKGDVSTVFLGLDHQYGSGPPLLFETMVFGGKLDGEMERYSTYSEAEDGHNAMLDRVLKL